MRKFWGLFGSLLYLSVVNAAVRAGTFHLSVVDDRDAPLPCRVLIRSESGESVTPSDAVTLKIGPDNWFMSSGTSSVPLAEGKFLLRIDRGPEYPRVKEQLEASGAETKYRVRLNRWINLRERGYLSGENHLHVAADRLAPMLVCEGLDFGNSLTWWNGPDAKVPPPTAGSGPIRDLSFAGRVVPTSIYCGELEKVWGAAYFQNLPSPMPFKSDAGRPNLGYLRYAIDNGATVHYQAGWSREVGLDALLGCVHVVNVCNNNFHLHRFQPRQKYSNLLDVPGFRIYENTDEQMMQMNFDSYYRLLNWGLRLAAGAESATGAKEVPVGYNRAYVRVPSNATLPQFYAAWAAGKNFVTNGPMLFLTVAEKEPGDTIELPESGGSLHAVVSALSEQPLKSVELIVNGDVVKSFDVQDASRVDGTADLVVPQGSWIAARATARDELLTDEELKVYANGDLQQPSRLRFGHTSPVYVTVGGRRTAVGKSIDEGLRMLHHLELYARDKASPEYLPSTLEAISQGRRILEERKAESAR